MKALEVKVLDVRGLTDIADFMVIASGTSDRHVRSVRSGWSRRPRRRAFAARRRGSAGRRLGAHRSARHDRARDAAAGARVLRTGEAVGHDGHEARRRAPEARLKLAQRAHEMPVDRRRYPPARLGQRAASSEYQKRLRTPLVLDCVGDSGRPRAAPAKTRSARWRAEGATCWPRSAGEDYVVALRDSRRQLDEHRAARARGSSERMREAEPLALLIGGPDGLAPECRAARRPALVPVAADAAAWAGAGGASPNSSIAP